MTTRPVGSSMYSVFSGSRARQSPGLEALTTSATEGLGGSSLAGAAQAPLANMPSSAVPMSTWIVVAAFMCSPFE